MMTNLRLGTLLNHRLLAGSRYNTPAARTRAYGITLVELMIALLITSVILIALTRVFVSTRNTYKADEGLARLQENARFAIQFLTHDLRMAGNTGCMGEPKSDPNRATIVTYLNGSAIPFGGPGVQDPLIYPTIRGFDAVGPTPGIPYTLPNIYPPSLISSTNPALDAALAPYGAVEGSDVLVLRFQNGDATPIDRALSDDSQIAVVPPHNITDNQVVMVSDCRNAYIFQVTGVSSAGASDILQHAAAGSPGNLCPTWGAGCALTRKAPQKRLCELDGITSIFGCGAQIAQLRAVTYFIGAGGPTSSPSAWVPALYRAVFDESGVAQAEELVEGVENMQVTYGVDTDGNDIVDRYLTAAQVAADNLWLQVQTVRVGLLVASSYSTTSQSEDGTDTTPFYDIGGMAQIAVQPDNRRRRVIVETIKIRNRPIPPEPPI